MKRIRHLFTLASALILSLSMQAQGGMPFQANPDNAFIAPNASSYTVIDILANDVYAFDCGLDALEVTILTNGTKGIARVRTADKKIEYRPRPNFIGADQVVYQIYCPATNKTSSATIYININDKPDAISDAECYVDPIGIEFEIKELAKSIENNVNVCSDVLSGDIDNDGEVELIVFDANPVVGQDYFAAQTSNILIYGFNQSSNSLYLKDVIALPDYTETISGTRIRPYGNCAIAKVEGEEYASIFTVYGSLLLKYSYNPTTKSFSESWRRSYTTNYLYDKGVPVIADFMGTGRVQVNVYDKIYNASDGILLVDGKQIPSSGIDNNVYFGIYGHAFVSQTFTSHRRATSLVVGDIDNDGILELVGGPAVYKVNITNYTGEVGNSMTRSVVASNPFKPGVVEGGTALVDLDNDGLLDVVVVARSMDMTVPYGSLYAYNPRTGLVMNTNDVDVLAYTNLATNTIYGPSLPFVGNLDGNTVGKTGIAFTTRLQLLSYNYNPITNKFEQILDMITSDNSASTTLSLFDFTQSGTAQLIYRDETDLRIIDGATGDTLSIFNNIQSPTFDEYAIVVDVNLDGSADIVTIGNGWGRLPDKITGVMTWDHGGKLQVYSAAGAKKWAPARTVWNQTGYNPVYVNDDLTIPARPISPATPFYSPDGTIDRPFNNFLQQSTSLNKEGTMIMLGPDLTFDARLPKKITKLDATDELKVEIGVVNQGDAVFNGPISLQLYAYFEATDTYVAVGAPYSYPNTSGLSNVTPNNNVALSYNIPNISTALPAGYDNLFMTVNLSTSPGQVPAFSGSTECHGGWNNIVSGLSLVQGQRIMCEGATETVHVNPKDNYTVKWYNESTGGAVLNIGDTFEVTKNSDIVTYYFVEAYKTPSSPNPISSIRDTIFVYRAPDSLVWTGKGNTKDWHDYLNWENPDKNYKELTSIPRPCTNVLLPTNISNYPDLDATNYTDYTNAECNNIHFEFGSEVVRPDMLQYSRAFVDVTFNSHRWYMFAPPLKDFYTGDFYRNSPIPFYDDIKAYTQYWAKRNPWKFSYTPDWTGLFYQPNESFVAGQGLGIWISDKSVSGQATPPRDPFEFSFPKQNLTYTIYKEDTPTPDPMEPVYNTPRTNHHRFIFDGVTAGADFDLTINGENKEVGQMVMVANPFMAHLDFDKFYAKNSALIQNYYCVIDENKILQYYNKNAATLSKNIAPMQAFLVEVKAPFDKMKANGTMTLSVPGDKLRSMSADPQSPDKLSLIITATQGTESAKAYIQFDIEADDKYVPGEDISGMYPTKATSDTRSLSVYSQTSDKMKTLVNKLNATNLKDRIVPLGAWSPKGNKSEDITINVSNLPAIPSEYEAILYDEVTKEEYRLKYNSMHTFKNITTDADLFVEGRFSLRFTKADNSSTGIEDEINNQTDVIAFVKDSKLYLRSGKEVKQVDVYNMQGQLLLNDNPNSSIAEYNLPKQDIYIVRVNLSGKVNSYKLINQ